jgi:plastocyanin
MSTNRGPRVLLALGGLTVALLTGCGSSGGTGEAAAAPTTSSSSSPAASSSAPPSAAEVVVHISGFAYQVAASVSPGATVSVMNMDGEAHTVTADEGAFDVVVAGGATSTFTAPTTPGTYAFHCTYHANMHGVLSVG